MIPAALVRTVAPYLIGAAVIACAWLGVRWYGSSQYKAGYSQAQLDQRLANVEIARAAQEDKDRADAIYRGAVLARDAAQKDAASARARVDGLLRDLRLARDAKPSPRPDAVGDDWIGILGACVAEYEFMGGEAGRLADKVNGLQGYVRAIRPSRP